MPSLQDTLLAEFQQIQGAVADSTEAWSKGGSQGLGGGQPDTAPKGNVDSLGDQTGRIDYGSSSSSSSSSSSGGALSDIEGVLAGGLGIVPLGLELASIFGGGSSTPPPLTRYAMPDSIGFVGSTGDSTANTNADFGQMGQLRSFGTSLEQSTDGNDGSTGAGFGQLGQPQTYSTPVRQPVQQYAVPAAPAQSAPSGGGGQSQPIQITVQAMDAQSFMDRSDEIASAVNKAILALHPIADTIQNL